MNFKHLLYCIIILLFFATCARQTSPTGGPQDTIPPKLISSTPLHRSTNFHDRKITLTFSEYVALNNPKEQLIITPSAGKDFEVTSKKNQVTIEFEKSLRDSTTYTINFRDAVQDITEKNPARNLLLAISTASYLDSLSIEGKVIDLLKSTEAKEITIAINPHSDTFNIFKHPATYFTKTDDKGNFKLDYLRPGIYDIYAIDDKNRNLVADTRTESYGFLATTINLIADTTEFVIPILRLDARPLKLTSARPYNTYFNIKATKNLKEAKLTTTDSTELKYNFGDDQSTIKLYNTFPKVDSIAINIFAADSIGNTLDTLVYAKFPERESEKEKFQSSMSDTKIYSQQSLLTAKYTFNKPVHSVNYDSLFFKRDSLTIVPVTSADITWNNFHTIATIKKQLDKSWFKTTDQQQPGLPNQQPTPQDSAAQLPVLNTLTARPGAFISIENDSSKSASQKINPLKIEDLSMFLYQIKTNNKKIIIQLVDKNLKVIQEHYNQTKGQFENVEPGDYSIRVINDINGNKQWDPGNYLLKIEPEKVYYFKTEDQKTLVNIKPNWEFDFPTLLITD